MLRVFAWTKTATKGAQRGQRYLSLKIATEAPEPNTSNSEPDPDIPD